MSVDTSLPFFTLADGLLGVEAEVMLKRVISRLAQKWKELYVKSRVAITLVRSTHHYTWGDRVPASCISVARSQW